MKSKHHLLKTVLTTVGSSLSIIFRFHVRRKVSVLLGEWGRAEGHHPASRALAAKKRGRFSFHSKSFCIFSSFVLVPWYICKHNTCSKINNWKQQPPPKRKKNLFSNTFEKTATPNQERLLQFKFAWDSISMQSMVTASNNLFWFPKPKEKNH